MKSDLCTYLIMAGAALLACLWPGTPPAAQDTAAMQLEREKTVIDQAGRRITVAEPFKRIISLYGAHTENLFALGLSSEIIGVSKSDVFPEAATRKPAFSYRQDPEVFLAARPDLVLIRPMIDRGYPQLIQRLEKSGITVISLQPATVEEMYRYWQILGRLTGRATRAAAMTAAFQQGTSRLQALTRAVRPKKRVYFEAIHKRMKTFSPRAMAIFALETAGGINIAGDAASVRGTNIAVYGKERILALAAEIDVYLAQKGAMNQPTRSLIKDEPGFQVLKAVRNDQVYIVDEMLVSRPTFRLLNGICAIGRALYPQRFGPEAQAILEAAERYKEDTPSKG